MSVLILRRPAVLQPAGPVEIDRSNALTAGLSFALTPGKTYTNLAKNGVATPVNGPSRLVTNRGLATSLNGTNHSIDTGQKFTSTNGTVMLWATGVGASSGSPCVAAQSSDDAGNAVGVGWQAGTFLINGLTAPATWTTGAEVLLVGTWGAGGIQSYVNGVLAGSHGSTAAPTAPAGNYNFHIGCFSYSGGRIFQFLEKTILFCKWDRALSSREIKAIQANPWQLFRTSRQIWIPAAEAGGGTTITGNIGTAVASGLTGTVNANRTLAGALGTATASGLQGAVNANRTIAGALGTAVASGLAGNVNANRTIAGALGTATASGFQGTVTNGNSTTITGSLGTAVATGFAGGVAWNRYIAGVLGVATASGFTGGVASGAQQQTQGGGGWLPHQTRRKTRKEVHAERVRLGILPPDIVKAAAKVAAKAETEQVFQAEKPKYQEMFMRELLVTKWSPDYTRAIQAQLEMIEQEEEDILLLM